MPRTRRRWLTQNIQRCEALLEELYRERDARTEQQLNPPQVAEQMQKLESSVYARRRYENKTLKDPALLEAHRRKSRESWRRKQAEKKREKAEKKVEQVAEQQPEQHVSAPPSFTLFV